MMLNKIITKSLLTAAIIVSCHFNLFPRSEYWQQRVSLFDCLPIGNEDIVFLGNSITDGGEFNELFSRPDIKNRGISGDVISGVRERLYQIVVGKPHKIFLLIGINDISHDIEAEKIVTEYEELVKEICTKSPSTKLYIQSVMPINNDFARYRNLLGKENVLKELNDTLPSIAKKYGATFIDLHPALSDTTTGKLKKEYTNDGLHLTGKGYMIWCSYISQYINE